MNRTALAIFWGFCAILLVVGLIAGEMGGSTPEASGFSETGTGGDPGSTGDFSVSVPLLTVKGRGGLDFPVSLSYSPGIRLDDEASWVGLGWDLGAGSIRRSINTIPDEFSDGFLNAAPGARRDFSDQDSYFVSIPAGSGRIFFDANKKAVLRNYREWKIEYDNPADGAISWWKITTEDGTQYVLNQALVEEVSTEDTRAVSCYWNGYNWRTTQDVVRSSDPLNELYPPYSYTYAWFLTAIMAPNYVDVTPFGVPDDNDKGNWIKFDYAVDATPYPQYTSPHRPPNIAPARIPCANPETDTNCWKMQGKSTQETQIGSRSLDWTYDYRFSGAVSSPGPAFNYLFSKRTYGLQRAYLSQITTPLQHAVFTIAYDRHDAKADAPCPANGCSPPRLDRITLQSRLASPAATIAEVRFTYRDTDGDASDELFLNSEGVPNQGRMTLQSVQSFSAGGTTALPPTSFTYHPTATYNFEDWDWWGYPSGKSTTAEGGNTGYDMTQCGPPAPPQYPDQNARIYKQPHTNHYTATEATTDSDPLQGPFQGSLQTITYPTGGNIEYEYAPDKWAYIQDDPGGPYTGKGGGARLKAKTVSDATGNSYTIDYTYGDGVTIENIWFVTAFIPEWQRTGPNSDVYVAYQWVKQTTPGHGSVQTDYVTAKDSGFADILPDYSGDQICQGRQRRLTVKDALRGMPKSTALFDEDGQQVKETVNDVASGSAFVQKAAYTDSAKNPDSKKKDCNYNYDLLSYAYRPRWTKTYHYFPPRPETEYILQRTDTTYNDANGLPATQTVGTEDGSGNPVGGKLNGVPTLIRTSTTYAFQNAVHIPSSFGGSGGDTDPQKAWIKQLFEATLAQKNLLGLPSVQQVEISQPSRFTGWKTLSKSYTQYWNYNPAVRPNPVDPTVTGPTLPATEMAKMQLYPEVTQSDCFEQVAASPFFQACTKASFGGQKIAQYDAYGNPTEVWDVLENPDNGGLGLRMYTYYWVHDPDGTGPLAAINTGLPQRVWTDLNWAGAGSNSPGSLPDPPAPDPTQVFNFYSPSVFTWYDHTTLLPERIQAVNDVRHGGRSSYYRYDEFGRLTATYPTLPASQWRTQPGVDSDGLPVYDGDEEPTTEYSYDYCVDDAEGCSLDNLNAVHTTTHAAGVPGGASDMPNTAKAFWDGLGRDLQKAVVVEPDVSEIRNFQTYNEIGKPESATKPFSMDAAAIRASLGAVASGQASTPAGKGSEGNLLTGDAVFASGGPPTLSASRAQAILSRDGGLFSNFIPLEVVAGAREVDRTWTYYMDDALARVKCVYPPGELPPDGDLDGIPGGTEADPTSDIDEADLCVPNTILKPGGGYAKFVKTAYDMEPTISMPDFTYGSIMRDFGPLFKSAVTDERGLRTVSYTDLWGNTVATIANADGLHTATAYDDDYIMTTYNYNPWGKATRVLDGVGNKFLVTLTPPNDPTRTEIKDQHLTHFNYDSLGRLKTLFHPDINRVEFRYDGAGNVLEKLSGHYDGASVVQDRKLAYEYDAAGRQVAMKTYMPPTAPPTSYLNLVVTDYDGAASEAANEYLGRVQSITTNRAPQQPGFLVSTTDAYDEAGRLIRTDAQYTAAFTGGSAKTYTTRYRYQPGGNLEAIQDPQGTVTWYTYNSLNQIGTVEYFTADGTYNIDNPNPAKPDVAAFGYTVNSLIDTILFGNNVLTKYTYSPRDWVQSIDTRKDFGDQSSDERIFQRVYKYDDSANMEAFYTAIQEAQLPLNPDRTPNPSYVPTPTSTAGAVSFTYDDISRLAGATDKSDVRGIVTTPSAYYRTDLDYSYDQLGNRKSERLYGVLNNYAYGSGLPSGSDFSPNRLLTTTPQGGSADYTFYYDLNGNMVRQVGSPNLLKDGGFEKEIPDDVQWGWDVSSVLAGLGDSQWRATHPVAAGVTIPAGMNAGSMAAKLDLTGPRAGSRAYINQILKLQPGRTYQVSGWVKTGPISTGNILIATHCYQNADGSGLGNPTVCPGTDNFHSPPVTTANSNWIQHTFPVTVNNPAYPYLGVLCYVSPGASPVATGTFYCDDISVRELTRMDFAYDEQNQLLGVNIINTYKGPLVWRENYYYDEDNLRVLKESVPKYVGAANEATCTQSTVYVYDANNNVIYEEEYGPGPTDTVCTPSCSDGLRNGIECAIDTGGLCDNICMPSSGGGSSPVFRAKLAPDP